MKCIVPGCENEHVRNKMCNKHSSRFYRTGSYDLPKKEKPFDKVMRQTIKNKNGCIEFKGYNINGYGRICINRVHVLAHRFIWEYYNGTIPAKNNVLHKCDNPSCVNIDHLFIGTQKDNYNDCFRKGRVNPVKRGKERWKKCPTQWKTSTMYNVKKWDIFTGWFRDYTKNNYVLINVSDISDKINSINKCKENK